MKVLYPALEKLMASKEWAPWVAEIEGMTYDADKMASFLEAHAQWRTRQEERRAAALQRGADGANGLVEEEGPLGTLARWSGPQEPCGCCEEERPAPVVEAGSEEGVPRGRREPKVGSKAELEGDGGEKGVDDALSRRKGLVGSEGEGEPLGDQETSAGEGPGGQRRRGPQGAQGPASPLRTASPLFRMRSEA